jgi:uncharacterized protein YggE
MIRTQLLTAILLLAPIATTAQTIQVSKDNRTIAITTTDEAEAPADRAKVNIGFTTCGPDQDATYADASKTSNAIMDALHAAGIKPEAIESTEQNLSAIDDNDKARYAKGIRFQASQGWVVTTSADSAAAVLHIAVTSGANNSGNISWELADDSALEADAASKALNHARAIADRMAKGLNAHLGALVYASNQTPARPGLFSMASAQSRVLGKENLKPLAIRPDKISRSATVYAVFSIE